MKQDIIDKVITEFSHPNEKKKAVDRLLQYLYFHLPEFGIYHADEDTRSDFLLWLYPKLHTIIGSYNPERSIFFTYLRMSITFHWKLFGRKNREQAAYSAIAQEEQQFITETALNEQDESHSYELYAASPRPEYSVSITKEQAIKQTIRQASKKKHIFARYLLLLACKSCFCIDDQLLQNIATRTEIPLREIKRLIETVKRQTYTRDSIYNALIIKRDFYYIRYKSATLQLRAIDETHESLIKRLKVQQEYSYTRWQRYLRRIKEYTRSPSNRSLARQFGVSRGTIDNDLVSLKKACYGTACIFT